MSPSGRIALSVKANDFLAEQHQAAMITIGADGVPKVARCGVALVDGRLWSSGTQGRVRTRRLRRDPRCTLYVHPAGWDWLALETTVTIREGAEAPELSLRLFRVMQSRPVGSLLWYGEELAEPDFLRRMVEEERVVYDFEVRKAYGPAA